MKSVKDKINRIAYALDDTPELWRIGIMNRAVRVWQLLGSQIITKLSESNEKHQK